MNEIDTRDKKEDEFLSDLSFTNFPFGTSSETSGLTDDLFYLRTLNVPNTLENHSYTVAVYNFQRTVCSTKHPKLIQSTDVTLERMDISLEYTDVKKDLSKKFNVPQDYVIVGSCPGTSKTIAAILDRRFSEDNLFLLTSSNQDSYSKHLWYCIQVDENMTVAEFLDIISIDEKQKDEEKLCLFAQGRIIESSMQKVNCLGLSNFSKCKYIHQLPITVTCHYHITPKIEILYNLDCINTDIVKEIKLKFLQQFGNELPFVWHKNDEIWFSYQTQVLEDDHFLVDDDTLLNVKGIGRCGRLQALEEITIHISSIDSIPIVASFNKDRKLIVIQRNVSTEELRCQIAKHFKTNPNSLKVQINKKKISDNVLPGTMDSFKPYCRIDVKSSKKTTYQVNVLFPDGNTCAESVELYKNDTVLQLKNLVAVSIKIHPFYLQLFCNAEMDDEKRLRECTIGCDEKIEVVVHENRILIVIKRSGHRELSTVIDNSCETKVLQIKTFASYIFEMDVLNMNIICNGKSLDNEDTLSEAGVRCNDKLFICSFSHSERKNDSGIFRLVCLDAKGEVFSDNAVIYHRGKQRPILDIDDLEEIPGTYQQPFQIQGNTKGIRLQKGKSNRKISKRPEQHGSTMTQDILETENSTSSSIRCPQNLIAPCQDNPREDLNTTIVKPITTQSPSVTYLQKDTELNPSNGTQDNHAQHMFPATRSKTIVCTEVIKDEYGNILSARQCNTRLSNVNWDEALPHSYSMPEFNSCPMALTRSFSQQSLHENTSRDELKSVYFRLRQDLGNEWPKLALILGLEKKDIDKIEYEHGKNLERQVQEMLWRWEQKMGKSANKEVLIRALRECDLNNIADEAVADLVGGPRGSHTHPKF